MGTSVTSQNNSQPEKPSSDYQSACRRVGVQWAEMAITVFQPHLLRSLALSLPVMLSSPLCPVDCFQAQAQLMHPLLREVLQVHGSTTATIPCAPPPHPVKCIRICSHAFLLTIPQNESLISLLGSLPPATPAPGPALSHSIFSVNAGWMGG